MGGRLLVVAVGVVGGRVTRRLRRWWRLRLVGGGGIRAWNRANNEAASLMVAGGVGSVGCCYRRPRYLEAFRFGASL